MRESKPRSRLVIWGVTNAVLNNRHLLFQTNDMDTHRRKKWTLTIRRFEFLVTDVFLATKRGTLTTGSQISRLAIWNLKH
ncbi:MAG: hypothetical protein KDA84_08545 [Planctomycetaceae bacterium]|nr:hypothetical protein [Planctomycetaceae bacterium]